MKYFVAIFLCCTMLLSTSLNAGAYTATEVQSITIEEDSGITIIEELSIQEIARSSTKSVTKTKTVQKDGATIAVIKLTAVFSYTGTSVGVVSKQVSDYATYNGWTFTQTYLGANGGTVSLAGKLTQPSEDSLNVAMSITCDVNGNIT